MEKIQVKIVPMNADHLDEIAALERVCFSRPWSRNMLAEELENQCAAFLTALDAATGKVVGYAGLLVAADVMKLAMIRVYDRLRRENLQAKLIMQVHDELIVECPEAERETVEMLLRQEMEQVAALSVPLIAEAHSGKNWLEAKG